MLFESHPDKAREAGADHVAIQVLGVEPGTSAMPRWRLLAEALLPQPATA